MRRLLAALLLPASLGAQEIVLREPGPLSISSIVRDAAAHPHAIRSGSGPLVLRRDTVITTSLIVLGQPTYLASQVQGDVIVVDGDLYLRPGSQISGRAIAIGGGVYRSMLGRVGGDVLSYRDDSYTIAGSAGRYELTYRGKQPDPPPTLQLAGLQGFMMPSYDRVNGLSLPVGAVVTVGQRLVEVQPSVTYRSRLGAFDPGVEIRLLTDRAVHLEADIGRSTRTNDAWIYSNLINSAVSLAFGNDSRNYFRADGGTARLFGKVTRAAYTVEPFLGGRYEKVSPITAAGNVFSFTGRRSVEHMARPNPLVERGAIGSVLGGADFKFGSGPLRAKLRAEGEQSVRTPTGTSSFLQVTMNGSVEFPTFGKQRLRVDAHSVTSSGDSVPRSRYAYLGRAGTLPLLELLEQGGDQLLLVESLYKIPIAAIVLPKVGSPTILLRHMMGAAGVKSLPKLEQQIGIGLGISLLRLDVTFDAAGNRKTKYGAGISLSN